MRLVVAAIGRRRGSPEAALIDGYAGRIGAVGRGLSLGPVDIVESDAARDPQVDERRRREWGWLSGVVPAGAKRIVLDERGASVPSAVFAARLGGWRDQGAPSACFLLGGPDGHAAQARESADLLLAFGPQTWPHLLARAMLLEQIYRAVTILAGHPYHRP